ncbi:hypothetical protein B0T16DRAFT_214279 [Cercophora newfieldiana]|uniref:Uncharacterized protein n=1 Tax=Cercophora newfieldiana TaxID=92897 RepID=A0AA39XW78_9PEZI|nr:hypothetical protein B0T16DRAFT_214279 [Cercophora newfieldiana]
MERVISAEFCQQGYTVTSFDTFLDCCPPTGSCLVGITCSTGYAVWTVLTSPAISKTTKLECAANAIVPVITGCLTSYLYQAQTSGSTSARSLMVGCGYIGLPGQVRSPRYFRTLTPGAEVNISTPTYPVGQLPDSRFVTFSDTTITLAEIPSRTGSTTGTATTGGLKTVLSSNGGPTPTDKVSPSQSTASGDGSPSTPNDNSSSEMSRSDKIAIGVGIGIGLPTVLIGLLAWFYPRQRWGEKLRRRNSTATT